jgi:PPK2 family polyphosphate:nucleotide phosphotransferase
VPAVASSTTLGLLEARRVHPGTEVDLGAHDTDETFGWDKAASIAELEGVKAQLDELQVRLYAEGTRSLLLVIQARDAAGKDGTIRSIFSGINPQGVVVTSFKAPAGPEARHDYLWRVHAAVPADGMIAVFNRSHYEDVLAVRVRQLVPEAVWSRRYRHINAFERMLADEGTTIVKVFLDVSKDKQAERFNERLTIPSKKWKFRVDDLDDRARWPEFTAAYEAMLSATSTEHAPWYVVPADRNWSRNLAVAKILLHTLERMDPAYPPPQEGLEGIVVE